MISRLDINLGCVAKNENSCVVCYELANTQKLWLSLMNSKEPFKWRHFQKEVILLNVRWYLKYPLSYRNLEEIMLERGLKVDHSTIGR
jgi:hypothetical protein